MSPAAEMREYLGEFAGRCRSQRWLGPLFHVGVLADIQTDLEAAERKRVDALYSAEQSLLELAKKLERDEAVAKQLRAIAERLRDIPAMMVLALGLFIGSAGYMSTLAAAVKGEVEPRTARISRVVRIRTQREQA